MDNDLEEINRLLSLGADVRDSFGQTPLDLLESSDDSKAYFESLKVLLKHGANFEMSTLLRLLKTNDLDRMIRLCLKFAKVSMLCLKLDHFINFGGSMNRWKVLIEHVALMQAVDLERVSQDTLEMISDKRRSKIYFDDCKAELSVAKSTKLEHCWITYFNLLVDDKKKLKNYAGNQDLVEAFKNPNCLRKFPIYKAAIMKKVEKGIKIRNTFDRSSVIFSKFLPIFSPNHLVVRDILDCLGSKDYDKFLSALW